MRTVAAPVAPPPPSASIWKSSAWNYIGLAIGVPLAAAALSFAIAAMAFRGIAGTSLIPDLEATAGGTLAIGIALFSGAFRSWRAIRRSEPDSVPKFRQRHRVTLWCSGILSSLILCGMVGTGVVWGLALKAPRPVPVHVPAAAEKSTGTVGTITDGTTSLPVADSRIVLMKTTKQGMQVLSIATSDAKGNFRFPDDSGEGSFALQTTYQGVLYEQAYPAGSFPNGMLLKVFDAAQSPQAAEVTAHVILLEPASGQIHVRERLTLNNKGLTSFENPELGGIRFYIPPAANEQFDVSVKAPGANVPINVGAERTDVPNVCKVDYPIRPGETTFDIDYYLPLSDRFEGRVVGIAGQPTANLRLIVPEGIVLQSPDVRVAGTEPTTQAAIFDVVATGDYVVTMRRAGKIRDVGQKR